TSAVPIPVAEPAAAAAVVAAGATALVAAGAFVDVVVAVDPQALRASTQTNAKKSRIPHLTGRSLPERHRDPDDLVDAAVLRASREHLDERDRLRGDRVGR